MPSPHFVSAGAPLPRRGATVAFAQQARNPRRIKTFAYNAVWTRTGARTRRTGVDANVVKRWVLAAAGLVGLMSFSSAWAGRNFPPDSFQVQVEAVSEGQMVIDGVIATMAPGVVVYGPQNTTLVRSALPSGVTARIEFDGNCMIRRVWILQDEEIVPVPMYQSLLGGSTPVPPTCTAQ